MSRRRKPDGWVQEAVYVVDLRAWMLQDGRVVARFRLGRAAQPLLEVEASSVDGAIIRAGKELEAQRALAANEIEVDAEPS